MAQAVAEQTEWVEVPFEVQKPQDGWRVDAYLAHRLHRYSRSAVQKLIENSQVSIAGRVVKPSTRVADGQTVVVKYPKREEPPPTVERLSVVYEDDHLLAVDKPGQVLSHPTDKIVENAVTTILKKQLPGLTLHLLHRLDRETSGVLLLAKDPRAARLMTEAFEGREVQKTYWALAAGRVEWARKTVDAPMERAEGHEIKVLQKAGTGLPAVTEFTRLAAHDAASLVEARPKTGRLHQIRVHLAHAGHPILGDKLYTGGGEYYMKAVRKELTDGDLGALGAPRQMLHARRLALTHPATKRSLVIEAPLPADFRACMDAAGLEAPRA
jgi:23S rRNA pseudouridine1911/1915/1917 synthase